MSIKYIGEGFGVIEPKANEKLVLRYVHTGNKVIRASSVDLATGVFTSSTTLTQTTGTIIPMILSYESYPNQLFNEWNGINNYGIEVIDSTSFYVVNRSSSNARVTYAVIAQNQSVDVTKLIFEYDWSQPTIDLSGLELGDNFRIIATGVRDRASWTGVYLNVTHSTGTYKTTLNLVDGRHFMTYRAEVYYSYIRELGLLFERGGANAYRQWNGGTNWTFNSSFEPSRSFNLFYDVKYVNITTQGGFSNNTVIEVYNW